MGTYSKKRLSHITPIKIFAEDERGKSHEVPDMKSTQSPRLLVNTPPPSEVAHHYDESLLARSPARSDASSSMKSRESALERRVSLLLRSESPTGSLGAGPSRSTTPQHFLEPSPCALPIPPEEPEEDEPPQEPPPMEPERKPQHKRFSSFAAVHFFSPKKMEDNSADSPPKLKAKKLTKRMSAAVHASTANKAGSRTPDHRSSEASSRNSPSLRNGIDASLKALTRAKTTLIRKTSPLVQRVYRKDKDKGKLDGGQRKITTANEQVSANNHLNIFAHSPASEPSESPNSTTGQMASTEKLCMSPRPCTSQTFPLLSNQRLNSSPTPVFADSALPMSQYAIPLSTNLDELVKRGTTRLRLAPSIRANGRRRLSVTDATSPCILDRLARPSTESMTSNVASSIASRAPDQELRRARGCIKRSAYFVDPECDRSSMASSKRPRSSGKFLSAKRSKDDVFVDSLGPTPSIAPSTAGTDGTGGALQERDPNKKLSPEDVGTVKTAKALKMSVSPKVKEVFNKFPRRKRSSHKPPKAPDARVSRASSKASRVLGHHFSSKEPLRPLPGNENAISRLREESQSEDELAL